VTFVRTLLHPIGAIGVGGYAYYDTSNVAKAAMALFSKEVVSLEGKSTDQV
jgi:hypothetical protein